MGGGRASVAGDSRCCAKTLAERGLTIGIAHTTIIPTDTAGLDMNIES